MVTDLAIHVKFKVYLANGKSITLTLSKGDNIQKQIKAGAAFMSEARSWVSSTKGNVAAMVFITISQH